MGRHKFIFYSISTLLLLIVIVLMMTGLGDRDVPFTIKNVEGFRDYVDSLGRVGPLVFLIIQFAQVVVAPIPGNVTALGGGLAFGWLMGFALSSLGLTLGSIFAFYLVRIHGRPLLLKFVRKETIDKYDKFFDGNYRFGLFMIFLLPFFPDDMLCFMAGLSKLRPKEFVLMVIFGRTPGMLVASLVGSGVVFISPAWFVLIASLSLGVIFLVGKYKQSFENWFLTKYDRRDGNGD